MLSQNNHIILMGFKHVGKTTIAKELAMKLQRPFADIDQQIERLYAQQFTQKLSYQQIMRKHNQDFFRSIETKALRQLLQTTSSVLALGGGTPLAEENQQLLKSHLLIHIVAPPNIVFERIMVNGRPAFFSPEEDPYTNFNRLWDTREKIYQALANITINNNESIELSVQHILEQL